MGWDTILFDLDGTLTDSHRSITESTAYALSCYGIHVEDTSTLKDFIGPPLQDSFMTRYGFSAQQAIEAIGKFREYFNREGWQKDVPYAGIAQVLKRLQAAGKTLLIATSKPEVYAIRILEYLDLLQYFSLVCGAPLAEHTGARKDLIVARALRESGVADLSRAVMVGDRSHDVIGGQKAGLETIGVLYGYGSREELLEAGAMTLAQDPEELCAILLS
ncbi:MAG: HAD family hydrolase [Ruminococcaceae bacterium]|nr:HAD family hydrolase [Oscillospiraceae bacterium]